MRVSDKRTNQEKEGKKNRRKISDVEAEENEHEKIENEGEEQGCDTKTQK